MKVNELINCQITGILEYGIFVACNDYTGLIHISEMSDAYIKDISNYTNVGDDIYVKVLEIDKSKKRLKLSYKQANPIDPKVFRNVKIKIGFHTLSNALPYWIKKAK